MSEATRTTITERQAEARRENGKKSQGPVSEEGKQRSSMNALKHGFWVKSVRPISKGPMREDKEVMERFVNEVVESLAPGESVLLRQSALDVAHKVWRQIRAQLWESDGYSAPTSASVDPSQMDWYQQTASQNRRGAEVIRFLPNSSSSVEEIWYALMPLAIELEVPDEDLEKLEDGDVARFLEDLIEKRFDSLEDAALLLDSKAEEAESTASLIGAAIRPYVIREELDSSFAKNSERMLSHAGRELDRSLKRYWELWERLQMNQPTVVGSAPQSDTSSESSESVPVPSPPVGTNPQDDDGEVAPCDIPSVLDQILGAAQGS